ncbi:MAG: hypothetical protein OXC63_01925 [Aestuariivita sp.]|nr:hypothetical protein [Aestuariivita sp.]
MAAPVWASSQNTQGQAKVWLEYKGPQVLDACDPGMPSTHSAVNVEAWGGFFEPGIDSGLKQARVAVSPYDVLEYATESPDNWVDIPSNGQLRLSLRKGDNIIYFRQKASSYAPMPSSERRTVRVSLQTSCSDCRGAPGGTPISSQRPVFNNSAVKSEPYDVKEGMACRESNHVRTQAAYRNTDCRIRTTSTPNDNGYHTWVDCEAFFSNEPKPYCGSVPGGIGSPVCTREAWYTCTPPADTGVTLRNNTGHYRVGNRGTVFNVQYNGYGCD